MHGKLKVVSLKSREPNQWSLMVRKAGVEGEDGWQWKKDFATKEEARKYAESFLVEGYDCTIEEFDPNE